jgi:cytochrome c2
MKLLATLLLLGLATAASANPFAKGNADAGKQFFDKNNCNQCHNTIMGGDGNQIFQRKDRKVNSVEGMIKQMHFCAGNVGITLTPQDEQNLGAYLNRYYKLK